MVLAGMPFRDAYKKVGRHERDLQNGNKPHHTHEGRLESFVTDIKLLMDQAIEKLGGRKSALGKLLS